MIQRAIIVFRVAVLGATCLVTVLVGAQSSEEAGRQLDADTFGVNFGRDVFTILQRSCIDCHGPKKQESSLRLDQKPSLSESSVVVPGEPDASELIRRISLPRDHDEIMPASGEQLTPKQIKVLRQWISDGAEWPENFVASKHWSYEIPRRSEMLTAGDDLWSRSPIDLFVLRRLKESSLVPSPQANPEVLLRRLYFDLTGLPPSPAEVDAFVSDSSDVRYQEVVDELLHRPQFGEKWARLWLDLARYADSHGFQRDDLRDSWAWRDWVIRALNDDMPFDQFTIEQIAGDLLPNATESQKIATGFHRCAATNVEAGSLPEETRAEQLIDRVNTTATVWLGSTLECAQCHDHKFDPFTATDYYRLLAFFNSTAIEADRTNPKQASSIAFQGPSMPIANPDRDRMREPLIEKLRGLEESLEARRSELGFGLEEWSKDLAARSAEAPVNHPLEVSEFRSLGNTDTAVGNDSSTSISGEIAGILSRDPESWTSDDRQRLLGHRVETDANAQKLNQQIAAVRKDIEEWISDTTLVMVEQNPPRPAYVFERGDYRQRGADVQPGTPATLHPMPTGPPNRLTLAKWLVDPANPLVARVTVNRWWAEIFGQGLVTTPEDFGIKGDLPSHPELLDWLSVEFMENNWSMKHVLRTIVLSSTYRQSSRISPQLAEIDDQNRLLARGPRFRLDAETVRDNALAISGLLNLKQFGDPIRPAQPDGLWAKVGGTQYDYVVSEGTEKYRRGIYIVFKRSAPYPSLVNFDATARLTCRVKRSRTNTPLQALTLLNDPVYVEASRALAHRVLTEKSEADFRTQLDFAFQLCTSRAPTKEELELLTRLLDAQSSAFAERPDDTKRIAGDSAQGLKRKDYELAAWYSVTAVLMNLHETITRRSAALRHASAGFAGSGAHPLPSPSRSAPDRMLVARAAYWLC